MDAQFLWLDDGRKTSRKRAGSARKKSSSKATSTKATSAGRGKVVKRKDFLGFLTNMLKLRIFYFGERCPHDAYRNN